MKWKAVLAPVAIAGSLSACSMSGLLGGGGKAPAYVLTLTPEAPDPGNVVRSASAGQAVTVTIPQAPKEIHSIRVPVQVTPTAIQYVSNLQYIETPDRLFAALVAETVRRTTNRVVLNPGQTTLDPGLVVSGELERFGYDEASGQVMVIYDASLSTQGGSHVETRRFIGTAPADGTANTVGPAINRAANQVAFDVARWIGNSNS